MPKRSGPDEDPSHRNRHHLDSLVRASRSSAAADDAAPRSTAKQRISESMPRQLDSSTNLTKDRELSVVVTSKLVTDC